MPKPKQPKPCVFIGSSVESLETAYAVQENLEHQAEVTVWPQGIFELSESTLESLLRVLKNFDFAAFIFSPDDALKIRNRNYKAVRDNVVFELGLFIGKLGKERTFIITPRNEPSLRFPTDLIGLNPGTYDARRADKNLLAALGPVCAKMGRTFKKHGVTKKKLSRRLSSQSVVDGLAQELRTQVMTAISARDSTIEKLLAQFEKRMDSALQSQRRVEVAGTPESYVINVISTKLSREARALAKGISRYHLTLDQYVALDRSQKLGKALQELRSHGFLEPLVGYDDQKNKIPVYWFPPELCESIRKVIGSYEPDGRAKKLVTKHLKLIEYG